MSVLSQTSIDTISAAVTPVVMISANAILISSVSSKHDSMASRLRLLAAEFRTPGTTMERQRVIQEQIRMFAKRLWRVSMAHLLLYGAAACFIGIVLMIAVSVVVQVPTEVSLVLLSAGVAMMFFAILFELVELHAAHVTIQLEIRDME